jgi:hypothetical protein
MNQFIQWLFLTASLLVAVPRPASSQDLRSCGSIFQEANSRYHCGQCSDNIYGLVRDLKEKNFDVSEAKVLYLYRRAPGLPYRIETSRLRPLKTREGASVTWSFHVVLLWKGEIYDFDYSPSPRPVPVATWIREMWETEKQNNGKWWHRILGPPHETFYRAIDANLYLEKHLPDNRAIKNPTGVYSYKNWMSDHFKASTERPFSLFIQDAARWSQLDSR